MLYRISAWLYNKNLKKLAYTIKSFNITLNGCDISPAAKIGKGITFCHTIGVVIGEGVIIGENATIYQNVTIGTRDGKKYEYPNIGDNITLFAGCVLAGAIDIGDNVTVGANSVLLKSVPENSTVIGIPAQIKKTLP